MESKNSFSKKEKKKEKIRLVKVKIKYVIIYCTNYKLMTVQKEDWTSCKLTAFLE